MAPEQVWDTVSTANTDMSGRVNRLIIAGSMRALVVDLSAPGAPDWIEEERKS
jgi:hypothetical protein